MSFERILPRGRALPRRAALAALLLTTCTSCAAVPTLPRRSPYDLVLRTLDGQRFDLTTVRGRVAIVTFFATWCLPCMIEVPHLSALYRDLRTRGLTIVGIGMDLEGERSLVPFVEAFRVPYPVLVADAEVREGRSPYERIDALPVTYVLDRAGKVAAGYQGPADPAGLRALVEELLR